MEFYTIALNYLKSMKIKVSKTFFHERIVSHPDYPSLVAFSDTLNELTLPHSIFTIKKEDYLGLTYPILLHIKSENKSTFAKVNSANALLEKKNDLFNKWDGICVYVTPKSSIKNIDHNLQLQKESNETNFSSICLSVIVILFTSMFWLNQSLVYCIIQILNIIGIVLCGIIVFHLLGHKNFISTKLCDSNNLTGCDKVLNSKVSLWRGISWGDIGLIYFAGMFFYLLPQFVFYLKNDFFDITYIPVIIGLLIAIFSVLYQLMVIRAWCKLCLLVDAVLVTQAIIYNYFISFNLASKISHSQIIFYIFILLLLSFVWGKYKKILIEKDTIKKKHMSTSKLMRDPKVFLALMYMQRQVDNAVWHNDIVLGNVKAPLKLIIASNPFCRPCAEVHKNLESLLTNHPDSLCVIVRFVVNPSDPNDYRLKAIKHIIATWQNGNNKAVDEWFQLMDLNLFIANNPVPPNSKFIDELIEKYGIWRNEYDIVYTPTIFINGYEWPKQFNLDVLNTMMLQLEENIINKKN